MNTQKIKPKLQNGGGTRKVFKISVDKTKSPPTIGVVEHNDETNDGVSFDDFYKSYVSNGQTGDKPMYIAVEITGDNKIEKFAIEAAPTDDGIGVIVNTPDTQSSNANSSANEVDTNISAKATQSDKQQGVTTSGEQQGNSVNQLDGGTTSVERVDRNLSSLKRGGKRNLTKRRKRRHSRK